MDTPKRVLAPLLLILALVLGACSASGGSSDSAVDQVDGAVGMDSAGDAEQPAAACLLVRRAAFDAVGGFDADFHPAWFEDVDF